MRGRCCVILVTLLCSVLGGCYAHRGGAIPRLDRATLAVPRSERIIVSTVKVESNTGGDSDLMRIGTNQIEAALRSAGADVKPTGAVADQDARLTVFLRADGSVIGQILSGLICGATFLIFPGYAGFDMSLDADVVARDGSRRQYHYYDTYSVWIEILLLPVTNSPDRVLEELIADMASSLARDMQRDGLLPQL
jgi:hypothetical protein